jgi:hypothetical protein
MILFFFPDRMIGKKISCYFPFKERITSKIRPFVLNSRSVKRAGCEGTSEPKETPRSEQMSYSIIGLIENKHSQNIVKHLNATIWSRRSPGQHANQIQTVQYTVVEDHPQELTGKKLFHLI